MSVPILLVDDDEDIRDVLRDILERNAHYTVMTACNGSDALRLLAEPGPPPAAILLDVLMPGMGGYEFLRWRELGGIGRGIPVILFTASPDEVQGSADALLMKPVAFEVLVDTIERLRHLHRSDPTWGTPRSVYRHDVAIRLID